jgi:plastocyanin
MTGKSRQTAVATLATIIALATPGAARAETPPRRAPARDRDIAALRSELAEQRELILKLTEMEGLHYEYLLKLIHSMGRPGTAALPPPPPVLVLPPGAASPPAGAAPSGAAGAAPPAPSAAESPEPDRAPAAAAPAATGVITGRVEVRGGVPGPAFVYVDNVKGPAPHGGTAEIAQKDRAFVPAALVVPRGTRVSFPNLDPLYHNVFSPSPAHPFDLGSYRQGDPARSVVLDTPGVVEIYCNMHAKMRASILVVPNRFFAKVGPDGTFRLENVPVGSRRLVAWAPDARPATSTVELTARGAQATLTLEVEAAPGHNNKLGKPYSQY